MKYDENDNKCHLLVRVANSHTRVVHHESIPSTNLGSLENELICRFGSASEKSAIFDLISPSNTKESGIAFNLEVQCRF